MVRFEIDLSILKNQAMLNLWKRVDLFVFARICESYKLSVDLYNRRWFT
jgi:hypothetical protein